MYGAARDRHDRRTVSWKQDDKQTASEELVNVITHAIGAALGIAGLSALVVGAARHGDPWRMVSFSIYGATLVILYLASVFYHGARSPRAKRLLQFFDHSAIYLLIAGTYTPFTLVSMRGAWGWTMFGLIWGLAIAGILLERILFRPTGVRFHDTLSAYGLARGDRHQAGHGRRERSRASSGSLPAASPTRSASFSMHGTGCPTPIPSGISSSWQAVSSTILPFISTFFRCGDPTRRLFSLAR